MELKGTLETMSIPDLLQWLADSEKTGTLVVNNNTERKEIYFKSGVIVSASSNLDKDRFGVLVVREGYVAQEELLKLLDEGKSTGKMLGRLCVEKGLFSEDEAQRMLQNQAEKIIESLIHRREGEFAFYEGNLPDKDIVEISIVMHQLFFDSAPKRDEWRRIHSILGSMNTVLGPSANPPGPFLTLNPSEQLLIALCDGKSSILKLCGKVDKSDFEICSVLTKLVENGWLIKSVSEKNQEVDEGLPDQLWQVSILLEQKRYYQALKLLEKLSSQFPQNVELESLIQKCKSQFDDDIKKTFQADTWHPFIQSGFDSKQLQSMNFKSQEWFLYSQINGLTSLRDLYAISGLSRQKTQMILYNLYKVGAIQFKETLTDSRTQSNRDVVQPTRQSAMYQTDSIRIPKSDTNRDIVPPRRSDPPMNARPVDRIITGTPSTPQRPSPKASESTQQIAIPNPVNTNPDSAVVVEKHENPSFLDLKELDALYQRYGKYNHYQVLGISHGATQSQIRDAFVMLSKRYHPDMHFHKLEPNVQERLEEIFSIINHAYKVISNNASRKRYDEESWSSAHTAAGSMDRVNEVYQVVNMERPPSSIPDFKLKPPKRSTADESAKPTSSSKEPIKKARVNSVDKNTSEPIGDELDGLKELENTLFEDENKNKPKWEQLFDEGKKLYNTGNTKQAIDSFESALKFNAKSPDVYYSLSRSYMKLPKADLEKAEENIKKALVLSPENAIFYVQLARVSVAKGDSKSAERFCKTALAWDSDNKEAKDIIKGMQEKGKFDFLKKFKLK